MSKLRVILKMFSLLSVICLLTSVVHAGAGNTGLAFLNLGVGARAIGMGGAFTGMADDASAGYWNPGGMTQLDGMEVLTMYDSLLEGMSHIYIGLGKKMDNGGVVGGQINYMTSGDITTSDVDGNSTGTSSQKDTAIVLTYAKDIQEGLSVGGNLKVISESIGSVGGSGFGLDGGVLYKMPSNLKLGFTLQNLGSGVKMKTETLSLPMTMRAGVSYNMLDKGYPLVINGDLGMITSDGSMNISVGGEYVYEMLAFRLGLTNTNIGMNPSFGIGLNQGSMSFDAGICMSGDLGSTFKISLLGRFGGMKTGIQKKKSVSTGKESDIDRQIKEAVAAGDFEKASLLKKKREQMKSSGAAAGTGSAEIEALKKEKDAAVAAGDFEKAAMLKKRIADLEKAGSVAAPAVSGGSSELEALKKEKDAAVAAGDFEKAGMLKKKIEALQQGGAPAAVNSNAAEIEQLKKEKDAAVASGDFEKAGMLKKKIEELQK